VQKCIRFGFIQMKEIQLKVIRWITYWMEHHYITWLITIREDWKFNIIIIIISITAYFSNTVILTHATLSSEAPLLPVIKEIRQVL